MAASAAATVSVETAKLVAGADKHTMDLDGDPLRVMWKKMKQL